MRIPFLKRIDRYLIAKFLGTYVFSILLIISIAVVFDFNENVDRFTSNHAPWSAILMDYYLNFIPYYSGGCGQTLGMAYTYYAVCPL